MEIKKKQQPLVLKNVPLDTILLEELLLVQKYKPDVKDQLKLPLLVQKHVKQECILLRVLLLVLLVLQILLQMGSILQMEPLHNDVHLNVMQDIKQEQIEIVLVRV